MIVKIKKLHEDAVIPFQKHSTDGAYDVVAVSHKYKGGLHIYGLGFAVEIPEGYRLRIVPRSSFTSTHLIMQNSDAIIDSGYLGEILCKYRDLRYYREGVSHFLDGVYAIGDRIAQCYLEPVIPIEWEEVTELSDTERGTGGFGSTGN